MRSSWIGFWCFAVVPAALAASPGCGSDVEPTGQAEGATGPGTTGSGSDSCAMSGCAADAYCAGACGFLNGATGTLQTTCTPRPATCDAEPAGKYCGCDGKWYDSTCAAHQAGSDASGGGCPQNITFCECNVAEEYCQKLVLDVSSTVVDYKCLPLPPECKAAPSCMCIGGQFCETQPNGQLVTYLYID